ncbi:hypothetical protein TWF718_007602 [Orbilia javanica]|uniref:CFEM domain-containing protein n=1 Tax=Orbilia javanica TaxID=47235 RepID=A0AAN8MUI7_9PEZI
MRFVSRLNLCFFLLKVASARSIILARAEPPSCIRNCLPDAVSATGCLPENATCICDSQAFYESLLPCVLINCGYADVSGLLSYGLEFCKRTGVNSAQRLSSGFGKPASSGGGDDDALVPTSSLAAPLEPTPAPGSETISSVDPAPVVASSTSTTVAKESLSVEDTLTPGSTSQTGAPIPVLAEPTTSLIVSTTALARLVETTSLDSKAAVSTTYIETPESLELEPTSSSASVSTASTRIAPGLFTIETSSKVKDSNTELVVIQTAEPTPKSIESPATTAPESTSAPPTPTLDEPSSASASVLHTFGQSSFNSFILCLFALLFLF